VERLVCVTTLVFGDGDTTVTRRRFDAI